MKIHDIYNDENRGFLFTKGVFVGKLKKDSVKKYV